MGWLAEVVTDKLVAVLMNILIVQEFYFTIQLPFGDVRSNSMWELEID